MEKAYFTFPNQATYDALGLFTTPEFAPVVYGVISNKDGEPVPGWHVNAKYIGELPDAVKPFQIAEPAYPKLGWFE